MANVVLRGSQHAESRRVRLVAGKSSLALAGAAVAFALASVANAADGDTTTWFDETLKTHRLSSTGSGEWITDAGRWLPKAGDKSTCSPAEQKVTLETRGNELSYRPCTMGNGKLGTGTSYSPYNTFTRITANDLVFTAFRGGEEWTCVEKIPLGGLSMRMHDEGTCTFIGWVSTRDSACVKGRWLELSAAGVAAEENRPYDVVTEMDFRAIPTRIRYLVDGQPLKDKNGCEWFSIRQGSLDPSAKSVDKRAGSAAKDAQGNYFLLGFNGSGSVGTISAETTAQPTERAAVTLDYETIVQPRPGTELGFAVTPNAGVALGKDLSYRWYLTDAAGREVPGSDRGTGATYALAAEDAGHWVSVDVSDENGYLGTGRYWFSDLPVVYIECKDEDGYVETDDETAQEGRIYYTADEDDNFTNKLAVAAGESLAPFREKYGRIFLLNVKTAWPTSKKEDHKAHFFITGNAEFSNEDGDGNPLPLYADPAGDYPSKIHVRGNSTANADKKPYKIKLDSKAGLFGFGKSKHWTLLANCFDESLMRNKLCYDYSGFLGLTYMKSEWVDVVMNGKYVGNYQLCEHIRVDKNRIDIFDWSSAYEDIAAACQKANTNLTDKVVDKIESFLEEEDQMWMTTGEFTYKGVKYTILPKGTAGGDDKNGYTVIYKKFDKDVSYTGGYIFELDYKKSGPRASVPAPSAFVQTHSGKGAYELCLSMNTPELCFANPDVSNFVWDCWYDIGQAWSSGDGYNAKRQHYTELCDFDSMVSYFLSMEVPGNNDAIALSRYAYKDVGGKMVFGPAWDFDYGLGSLQIRTTSPVVIDKYGEARYAPINPRAWIPSAAPQNFIGGWTWDPYFMFKVREKYWATRDYLAELVADGGIIDRYRAKLEKSARANDLRWNNRIGFFGNAEEMGDVDVLKEFLTQRFDWLDGQMGPNLGAALPKLTQTATSSGRYSRSATIVPVIAGAAPLAGSPETDIVDVSAPADTMSFTMTVTVPTANAVSLDVYANGRYWGSAPVYGQKALASVPAAALKLGERNLLWFVAKKSDGTTLANNVALLTVAMPETVRPGEEVVVAASSQEVADEAAAKVTPVAVNDEAAEAGQVKVLKIVAVEVKDAGGKFALKTDIDQKAKAFVKPDVAVADMASGLSDVASASDGDEVTISVPAASVTPGLYYSVDVATELGGETDFAEQPGKRALATKAGLTLKVKKPENTDKAFFKLSEHMTPSGE